MSDWGGPRKYQALSETIETVRTTFREKREAITALDDALAEERRELKVGAFQEDRDMTAAEVSRRKEIAATRLELAEALSELGLDTLEALDNASDLDDLLKEINAVNQQLRDDLDHLKAIERYAEMAAKVAELLSQATTKLAALRPSLL